MKPLSLSCVLCVCQQPWHPRKKDGTMARGRKHRGKFHLITCYEGKLGVQVQLYSLFNLGAGWGWVINNMPWPLYPLEWSGTHCIRGWMGPWTSLDRYRKSHPHHDSILGGSVQPVVIHITNYATWHMKRDGRKREVLWFY